MSNPERRIYNAAERKLIEEGRRVEAKARWSLRYQNANAEQKTRMVRKGPPA